MDAVKLNLESHEVGKKDGINPEQQDLLNSSLKRTVQLEARANCKGSPEMVQMMAHTQYLEQKQKKYDDWKATLSAELDSKFKAQTEKIDHVKDHLKTQDGKLDQLMTCVDQLIKNCAT
eukprot:8299721-Ditylum_brightwellii.AAC.2